MTKTKTNFGQSFFFTHRGYWSKLCNDENDLKQTQISRVMQAMQNI